MLRATKRKPRPRYLEAGTALLQGKQPLEALDIYMDGFHFYNDAAAPHGQYPPASPARTGSK